MMIKNTNYEILNSEGQFVNFLGIDKKNKKSGLSITLENGDNIKCSDNHIFLVNNMNVHANSLTVNNSYLSTLEGDYWVRSIEKITNETIMYDIVEADMGYSYVTNNIISHNCSFLGSGDNFIAEEYIKNIQENQIQTPIRQEYIDNEMYIWEDPEPDGVYIQSIDVSSGHGDDFSTINIYKIEEYVEIKKIIKNGVTKEKKVRTHKAIQVAEYYNRILPQTLGEIGYEYGNRYNNAYTIVDVTGGYGAQTLEKLFELGYENIHYGEINHKPTRDRLNGYIKTSQKTLPDGKISKIDLIPGFFLGSNRGSVLIEFQRCINMGDVVIRSSRLLEEIKTFVTVSGNRVADHKRSFHDDSIMSTSMLLYSIYHELFKMSDSKEKIKKMLDSMIVLGSNDVIEKVIKENDPNMSTRTPDYRIIKNNPYGANNWLFNGLKNKK